MSRFFVTLCVLLLGTCSSTIGFAESTSSQNAAKLSLNEKLLGRALSFEENKGQIAAPVEFLSRGRNFNLLLTPNAAIYQLPDAGCSNRRQERSAPLEQGKSSLCQMVSLEMKMLNASGQGHMSGEGKLETKTDYFIGNDESRWHRGISSFQSIRYRNIYKGIDLVYRGSEQHLEYDFHLRPGARPELIELEFSGANKVELTSRGDLVFAFNGLEINHRAPVAYQIIDGEERLVPAKFVLSEKSRVGFQVGEFDPSKELVIDPVIYASYLGASDGDSVYDIAVDGDGNIYTAWETRPYVSPTGSYSNIVITKFNPEGTTAIYSRYIGGGRDEVPFGIDVTADGDVYVTGITYSPDFPMRFAHQSTHAISVLNLDFMAYYVRLNPDGEIRHSTFLGGGCPGTYTQNYANSIVTDSEGNAYLTGYTCSPSFPVKDAFQSTLQGSYNSFLTKYDSFGYISYSTYFGGSSGATSFGDIALDRQNKVYITGNAVAGLYTTAGAYSTSGTGFVAKFDTNAAGSRSLIYSTYIPDRGYSIGIDPSGNAWIGSNSSLLKLNSTGGSLLFNRQGIASRLNDIAVDRNGSVYYVSVGTSVNFKVIGIRPDGSLIEEVTVGTGTSRIKANIWGIALGPEAGMIYVGGYTRAPDFPTTSDAYQTVSNVTNFGQGFFAKVKLAAEEPEPLIFIPGIAGSTLYGADENRDPVINTIFPSELWTNGIFDPTGVSLSKLSLEPDNQSPVVAVDAVREWTSDLIPYVGKIYKPLLDHLANSSFGFVEYDIQGNPKKRSSQCDGNFNGKKPTLFVFAYDWRLSDVGAAEELKDYVDCIGRFYPGQRVNILAHSQGGLIARRYIFKNPGRHNVGKLITLGAPFLGAPKAIDGLYTNRFIGTSFWRGFLINDGAGIYFKREAVGRIIPYSMGVHELLPTSSYFVFAETPPFAYKWPFLRKVTEYNYEETKEFVNDSFSSLPYDNSAAFHEGGNIAQDDWRFDTSGVKYYHIHAKQEWAMTPVQLIVAPFSIYPQDEEEFRYGVKNKYGQGDGTVPVISARRVSDLLAPNTTVKRCDSPSWWSDGDYSHNGMLANPIVWRSILAILRDQDNAECVTEFPDPLRVAEGQVSSKEGAGGLAANSDSDSSPEMVSLSVYGVDRLQIADELGNMNLPVGYAAEQQVPGVIYEEGSGPEAALVVPSEVYFVAGKAVDIKFQSPPQRIRIEISSGAARANNSRLIKYMDLLLPSGVTTLLRFGADGAENLRYDTDSDGVFETEVPPTFSLIGAAANDETEPVIDVSFTINHNVASVTVAAVDNETGINQIRYIVEGEATDRVYTAPFQLDLTQSKLLYVSAEDRAGNRNLLAKWIDVAPPASSMNQAPAANSAGWSKTDVDVELKSLDDLGGAGVESLTFAATGAQPIPEETLTAPQDAPFTFPQPAGPSDFLAKNIGVNAEGITTLTFFAKDRAGNLETAKTLAVKIDRTAPVSAGGFELTGGRATVALAGTDALSGIGSIAYSIDGGAMQNYLTPFVVTGGGDHTITYFATDAAGNVEPSQNLTFKIEGGNPSVSIAAPASGAIFPVRTTVNFTGSFSGDQCGTHNAVWTFNNLTQAGIVNETSRLVSATRAFTEAGVYQVQLTVDNGCGGTGSVNTVEGLPALVVVYDPEGSFVTGGGWFNSPAGAFAANPNFVGKASFGFNSKYHKGESTPTGNTLFQLQAGDFSFKSTGYEWLVVSGAKAQYQGSGTVNGSGNYGFILTTNDGQINGGADKVRIRIWERNTNVVVYDSQPGAPDGSNASTGLGGGSIVIH